MTDSKQSPQPGPSNLGRMACSFCRRRKLKCDRRSPCESCQKFGFDCEYAPGSSSGNGRPDVKSSRVRQLEDRLGQSQHSKAYLIAAYLAYKRIGRVEHLLHSKNKRDSGSGPTSSAAQNAAVGTDRIEASLDSEAIRVL